MMECKPESGHVHSVCTLWEELMELACWHGIAFTVVGLQLIVERANVIEEEKKTKIIKGTTAFYE